MRTALDSASCGIIVYEALKDESGVIRKWHPSLTNRTADSLLAAFSDDPTNRAASFFDEAGLQEPAADALGSGQLKQHTAWLTQPTKERTCFDLTLAPYERGITLTIQTETATRRQNDLLLTALDNTPNAFVAYEAVRGTDGAILDYRTICYNQLALDILHVTPEQLEQQLLFQRRPESRLEADTMRRIVDEHDVVDREVFWPVQQRWYVVQSRAFGDGFFTLFQDIDTEKRAKQQLIEQQTMLQAVMDFSDSYITYCESERDESGQIIDFIYRLTNAFVNKLIGRPSEQIVGQRMTQFFPSIKQIGLFQRYVQVVESGESQTFEFPYQADGYDGWFLISATPLADGFVLSFKDISEIKQVSLTIERQKTFLDSVMEHSPNSITVERAIRDDTGQIIDFQAILINPAALALGGHSQAEALSTPISQLNPMFVPSGLLAAYRQVMETGEPFYVSFPFPRINGWLQLAVARIDTDTLISVFTDITESQQALVKLQKQHELLEGIMNATLSAVTLYEPVLDESGQLLDFRVVMTNAASLGFSKRRYDEVVGKTMTEIYPKTREIGLWNRYIEVYQTGQPCRVEHYYHHIDSWFDVAVSKLGEGIVITFNDVTTSKKAIRKIEQQASILQTVLDGCQTPIALFEAIRDENETITDFRYILQNEANAQLVSHPLSETQHRTMLEVLPNLRTLGIFDRYIDVVETGQPQRFQHYFEDRGIEGWFDFSLIRHGDGLIVAAQDQTLLKKSLHRSEQLINELQRSNHSLEQFAYVASHDLQEPLRKIQSFGDVLRQQYGSALDYTGQDIILRMQSAAGRMQTLIRDLLTYSRLSTQQNLVDTVNLSDLLQTIRNDLDTIVQEKNARLTIGALPTLMGNATQLRQLFQNLLSNALKFSKPLGTPGAEQPIISVTAEQISWKAVPAEVPDRQRVDWVAISVADNGIGFDQQYSDRVFQLFERLHGRNQYPGTGLGLSIARRVAENHGGTVTVRSQPGNGTTFTVYLPEQRGRKGEEGGKE
ncbi:PAS domain-containing protein [Fibrisoma montanum]|uniref:histidine kinase n=2 Tax=Fibrisoma montanum TaxID=2305895 RepID=A0A418M6W4_9BACT|nr:PAS domain-containing protein [Fibrisoma montanum]